MNARQKNISVTSHISGNDFHNKEWFTVADFNNTVTRIKTERVPEWNEQVKNFFEENGDKVLEVKDNGRFAGRFEITIEQEMPTVHKFNSLQAAKKFQKRLQNELK